MKRTRRVAAFAIWLMLGFALATANAQKPLYVVAFVDIAGAGPRLEEAIQLLRGYASDTLKDAGAIRFDVLQQDSRRNHFAVVEVWQNRKTFEAHLALEHTKQFREKIQPFLGSPFDERLHSLLP